MKFSKTEAALVFGTLDSGFKPNSRGRARGAATYRSGNNPTALSIDLSNGGRYYDHVLGEGGDVVDYVRKHLGCGFRGLQSSRRLGPDASDPFRRKQTTPCLKKP